MYPRIIYGPINRYIANRNSHQGLYIIVNAIAIANGDSAIIVSSMNSIAVVQESTSFSKKVSLLSSIIFIYFSL